MRIILSMVAISLGIAIAIVAGVYGWQRYSAAPIPMAATPAPAPPPASAPEAKPAEPVAEAPAPGSVAPTTSPKPEPVVPALPAPKQPAMPTTAAPPTFAGAGAQPLPSAMPNAASESDVENQPIAIAEAPALATPEKLESLEIGMTEGDVIQVMGSEGVETPADQLPQFTPIGWYEVRWANADGSYIAAHFNQERTLRYVQPFNMPGAYAWLESPHYAVPAWLNDLLQANNLIVRVPSVDVVEARPSTFQFQGGLVAANGQTLGSISGTYYIGEAAGSNRRGIEGSYSYALPDGRSDANTFQFVE